MVETVTPIATCSGCHHRWQPYNSIVLPNELILECPACGKTENHKWLDSDTKKKYYQRQMGLEETGDLGSKIENLFKRLSLLESKIDLETKQRELTDAKMKEVAEWAKRRELDFMDIEAIAQEMRDDEQLRRDGR